MLSESDRSVGSFLEKARPIEEILWSSDDIALAEEEDVKLRPGEEREVKIQLTPESIPSPYRIFLERVRSLSHSERSRDAQTFKAIEGIRGREPAEDIYFHLRENGINSLEGVDPEFLQPTVRLKNYALRTNIVRGNAPLFRLYFPGGTHLVGGALEECALLLDGEKIDESMLRRNQRGEAVALRIPLDLDSRMYIPPGRDPIAIDPFSPHQRGQIKELEVKVPETTAIIPYLVFSQHEFTWPEDMYGLVRPFAYAGLNGKETHRSVSAHGTSQLFDPGRKWRMLFELQGRTTPEESANFIDVDLFRITA